MDAELEKNLREMLDKAAIKEALVRMTRGFDRLDVDLAASAFHDDAIYEHWVFPGPVKGARKIADTLIDFLRNEQVIWLPHFLLQSYVELRGDVAFSEDHALTCRQDRTNSKEVRVYMRALRLIHRWERRDGKTWKVAFRTALLDGFEIGGPLPNSGYPEWAYGRRGPRDITFHWDEALQPGKPYSFK